MSLDDNTIACARIVEKGDPLRFRTTMAAPLETRKVLFPLYAFNVEVSRAPWVTAEPMIAEMRLQWWRDALEEIAQGRAVRKHEVTTPLAAILRPEHARLLDQLIDARRWDVHKDPFKDAGHFHGYIDHTSGHLMWVAAQLLGAPDDITIRPLAYAGGLAAFLRAVPALTAAGRIPLIDGTHSGLRELAREALYKTPGILRSFNPATWPAIGARTTLRQILKDPSAVSDGRLHSGLTTQRLLLTSLTGFL